MKEKMLILGGTGLIGARIAELAKADYEVFTPSHKELDPLEKDALQRYRQSHFFETVINCIGYTDVDGAEKEAGDKHGLVYKLNTELPELLAEQAVRYGFHLIHLSSEYVFDGKKTKAPYTEQDETHPLGWYGETKLLGDNYAQTVGDDNLSILRISMPYGSNHPTKNDLGKTLLNRLKEGKPIQAVSDNKITPIYIDRIYESIKLILDDREYCDGDIYHLAPKDSMSLFDFANLIAEKAHLDKSLITPIFFKNYWNPKIKTGAAQRPKNSWLNGRLLSDALEYKQKTIEEDVEEWLSQIKN